MSDSIAVFRSELYHAARRRIRKRRRRLVLAGVSAVAAAVCTGITLAATGVFTPSPAPPEVIEDFASYTPQLGFHPRPGRAQLVARDGEDFLLFATTNREGTYCIVTSAPWKRPGKLNDGGTCVTKRDAAQPIAAGVPAAGASDEEGRTVLVVAGRVQHRAARTITFDSPTAEPIELSLGAGGFFIAAVDFTLCPERDWEPTFSARDEGGHELVHAQIELVTVQHDPRVKDGPPVCGFGVAPHGPYHPGW